MVSAQAGQELAPTGAALAFHPARGLGRRPQSRCQPDAHAGRRGGSPSARSPPRRSTPTTPARLCASPAKVD